MAEILETIMLVCFGFSWPMNAYKNAKAKSAKNMSLPFTILIMLGYVAGITAKILKMSSGEDVPIYVLVVYIINFVMVSANFVIYFINRKYDQKAEQEAKK